MASPSVLESRAISLLEPLAKLDNITWDEKVIRQVNIFLQNSGWDRRWVRSIVFEITQGDEPKIIPQCLVAKDEDVDDVIEGLIYDKKGALGSEYIPFDLARLFGSTVSQECIDPNRQITTPVSTNFPRRQTVFFCPPSSAINWVPSRRF
jgi:hypothetical protein